MSVWKNPPIESADLFHHTTSKPNTFFFNPGNAYLVKAEKIFAILGQDEIIPGVISSSSQTANSMEVQTAAERLPQFTPITRIIIQHVGIFEAKLKNQMHSKRYSKRHFEQQYPLEMQKGEWMNISTVMLLKNKRAINQAFVNILQITVLFALHEGGQTHPLHPQFIV